MKLYFFFGVVFILTFWGSVKCQHAYDVLNQYKYFVVKPENSKVDYAEPINEILKETLVKCGIDNFVEPSVMYSPQYDQEQMMTCEFDVRNIAYPKVELKGEINFIDYDNTIVLSTSATEKYSFYNEKSVLKLVASMLEPFMGFKYMYLEKKSKSIVSREQSEPSKPVTKVASDIDVNIPANNIEQKNSYCLIIGNENYSSFQSGLKTEVNVDYAENDARIFQKYCIATLGIPLKNTKLLINATTSQMLQGLDWISMIAEADTMAHLYFYFAGHGLPHEETKEAYIMPVDVSGVKLEYAIKLADVFEFLTKNHPKSATAFLDACFSGGGRNEGLLALRGVKIKPREIDLDKKLTVFSSSSGDESSAPYHEKQHGMFTYFLLKKLQDTKGDITYGELWDYVYNQTRLNSLLINNKVQTPQVKGTQSISEDWKSMTFIKQ